MATAKLRVGLLLLTCLLAALSGSAPARGDAPPVRTVEGIATNQAGKPAAHVMLYLFGLPPGQTDGITLLPGCREKPAQSLCRFSRARRCGWYCPRRLPCTGGSRSAVGAYLACRRSSGFAPPTRAKEV